MFEDWTLQLLVVRTKTLVLMRFPQPTHFLHKERRLKKEEEEEEELEEQWGETNEYLQKEGEEEKKVDVD